MQPPSAFTVSPGHAGITLAACVREIAPGTSWSKAKELCAGGRVQVNGVPATDPARRMSAGERVEIRIGSQADAALSHLVVHLDADVAVVRKPAGILTVPFERDDRDTLLALARVAVRRMEAAKGKERSATLRAVQRLDKETSGLVVFARNIPAQRDLQAQLGEHTVLRRYLALVHGAAEDAVYETLFVPNRGDGLRGSWGVFRAPRGESPPEAREAITRVKVEERLQGATQGRLRAGDRAPAPDPHPPRRGRPSSGRGDRLHPRLPRPAPLRSPAHAPRRRAGFRPPPHRQARPLRGAAAGGFRSGAGAVAEAGGAGVKRGS